MRSGSIRIPCFHGDGVFATTIASLATLYLLTWSVPIFAQSKQDDSTVEEIVVTGSYVARPTQATQSSPIQIVDTGQIDESGFVGVDDLLLLNTANIGSVGGAQDLAAGGADDRATRSANLRGLGNQSTLVLLNGRRLASTDGYTNLVSMVPTIAVNRVETVLDGASALYGSDAIAGVINVITDKNFEGIKLSGQYTAISDAPRYIVQGMIGGGTDTLHAVISASYEYQDKLQGYERSVTNFDNTSGLSQPGQFILSQRPTAAGGGDIIYDNGVNGPVNYSQFYDQLVALTGSTTVTIADPDCTVPGTGGIYAGDQSNFPDPAGRCRFSYQQRNPVIPLSEVTLVHGDLQYDYAENHSFYMETRYYYQHDQRYGIGSFPIIQGTLVMPAANPYNLWGVDATFTGRLRGNQSPDRVEKITVHGYHGMVGFKGSLTSDSKWNYDVSGTISSEQYDRNGKDTDLIAAQNAFNGFGGDLCQIGPDGTPSPTETAGQGNCYWFSPFGKDQQNNDPATDYNILTPTLLTNKNRLSFVEAVVTGDLWDMPGGTVGVAFGAQHRVEQQSSEADSGFINNRFGFWPRAFPYSVSRDINSVFTEFYLPFADSLDAQLAVRYEDYGGFTTTDPKLGINWRPTESLAFRASASTAFRAPDVTETAPGRVQPGVGQTVDPLDPSDTGTFRVIRQVSNPNLAPEESTNYNFGVTWQPAEGLSTSLDYWSFDFTNQIALEAAQQVINADPNGPAIQRDQFGRMLSVDITFFNSGATKTDGLDWRLDYARDTDFGTLSINNSLTKILTYEVQLGQGTGNIDALGGRNGTNPGAPAPELRDNLRLGWARGNQSANLNIRYTDSVSDDLAGGAKIDAWTVLDVQYALNFGDDEKYQLAVGALNLTDEEPPNAAFTGYLPSLEDALGRQAYVRFTYQP
jgi:iron complex outermembrane recepter protein